MRAASERIGSTRTDTGVLTVPLLPVVMSLRAGEELELMSVSWRGCEHHAEVCKHIEHASKPQLRQAEPDGVPRSFEVSSCSDGSIYD